MAIIANNAQEVRRRIELACAAAGRPVQSVTLLAVSKTFGADAVREAHAAGLHCFGENYVQEALDKIATLADLRPHIEWHLIGPLQSNKTGVVAQQFDWVHSVDRLKIAQRLSAQRPPGLPPLNLSAGQRQRRSQQGRRCARGSAGAGPRGGRPARAEAARADGHSRAGQRPGRAARPAPAPARAA
jgi:uncharacterized pyridoxal phosphate-containing UPF0001 family protein